MNELINRLLSKYDELIDELKKVNEENQSFLDSATKNKNVPLAEMEVRMKMAKSNLERLNFAQAERDNLKENYLNK